MYDFEKLGVFYLGKRVATDADSLTDELVLYDSRDLTTHAVIIGMTGSGKTGLGIGLLEEAALDHIPVIAIDPKGDLGNLLLTFPELKPEDFRPWINSRQAADQGLTPDEHARAEAALWKKGLADWGQDGERIARLRQSAEMAIYTPGSNAGLPVSVLQSFAAPARQLVLDVDLYRERIQATVAGLLSLVGIDADPVTSREHILLSKIFDDRWQQGLDLDITNLIAAIQKPPFDRVGVMALESFYPAGDRFQLAMSLNNLLAAPGFEAWMQGDALSAAKLLYSDGGKPRISIMSIAHLAESERMFFVSMLLNEVIAWMRSQQGTTSLRAVLYMDEIFGYMPPVENPPSKKLFLTLLKQARAYGLGLALATQNPVDLDYKGLSNTGTWFIGRLQTATKTTTLENRLLRARQAIEREAGQSNKKMVDTAVSFGTAILGAVLGRKRLSSSTASRVGTAIRSASGARKQASDVTRARQTEEKVLADIEQLNADLEAEVAALDTSYDAQEEELTGILVKPKATDVHVPLFGLLWMPYRDAGDGRLETAW